MSEDTYWKNEALQAVQSHRSLGDRFHWHLWYCVVFVVAVVLWSSTSSVSSTVSSTVYYLFLSCRFFRFNFFSFFPGSPCSYPAQYPTIAFTFVSFTLIFFVLFFLHRQRRPKAPNNTAKDTSTTRLYLLLQIPRLITYQIFALIHSR